MIGRVLLEPTPTFELFEVFTIEETEDVPLAPTLEVLTNVIFNEVINGDVVSLYVLKSDIVDPPLSFDVLPRFISRTNGVLTLSYMDLSILEYFCLSLVMTILPHVHPTHPQHISLVLMISIRKVTQMRSTSLILTIVSLKREFPHLLMTMR